jgi:hypothetical protein
MENLSILGGGRWRILVWGAIAGIIALPAVAMQFTREVDWTATDFVFAGVLLGAAGLLWELTMRVTRNPLYRVVAGIAILGLVMLVWAEAAVGILH